MFENISQIEIIKYFSIGVINKTFIIYKSKLDNNNYLSEVFIQNNKIIFKKINEDEHIKVNLIIKDILFDRVDNIVALNYRELNEDFLNTKEIIFEDSKMLNIIDEYIKKIIIFSYESVQDTKKSQTKKGLIIFFISLVIIYFSAFYKTKFDWKYTVVIVLSIIFSSIAAPIAFFNRNKKISESFKKIFLLSFIISIFLSIEFFIELFALLLIFGKNATTLIIFIVIGILILSLILSFMYALVKYFCSMILNKVYCNKFIVYFIMFYVYMIPIFIIFGKIFNYVIFAM